MKNPIQFGVPAKEGTVDYALNKPRKRTSAYVKYEFLDNESNKTAYSGGAGTYVGTKNILNLGAGFMHQPKMTSQLVNDEERFYDFKNWAVDLFYDAPLNKEKGTAITSYFGFFSTDFGPDYIRNVGANDITSGGGIRTQKTGKIVHIPLHPFVIDILKKRNNEFPGMIPEQKINVALKSIGQKAKLNEDVVIKRTIGGVLIETPFKKHALLTNHTARRSFCTNAYKADMPVIDIMALSGHTSEKIFYNYIKASPMVRLEKISQHAFFN